MKNSVRLLLCVFIFVASILKANADGSKDMYPRGVRGNRAFLVAKQVEPQRILLNQAAHYVYARAGETIAVASSAQGVGQGQIVLTSPNGKTYKTDLGSIVGRIQAKNGYTTRAAELAGPHVGYTPFEREVFPDQEGIWRVEFIPSSYVSRAPQKILADDIWKQPEDGDLIAAWDVSVRKGTQWLRGRVFFHVLNLYLSEASIEDDKGGFYGKNYVMTKDGYIYRVDGNGSHGINFFYFVNSSGFLDDNRKPSYKSSNLGEKAKYHNPNAPDDDLHVTHKMMYTMPDIAMPSSSSGAVPGGHTWLYQKTQIPQIRDVSISFIEGNRNYVNQKGAFVQFDANCAGRYKIVIAPAGTGPQFTKREILFEATAGANRVWWDGRDGQGNFVPEGEQYPVVVSIALIEGEIHFPYIDMEINPNGILVDRMLPNGTIDSPAPLYWDDREITLGPSSEHSHPLFNLEGENHPQKRHAWGTHRRQDGDYNPQLNPSNGNYGSYSFGNDQAMDTWSYVTQIKESIRQNITVKTADLEVVSITVDKDAVEPGQEVNYTVVVKNKGTTDAIEATLEYDLPEGFIIQNVTTKSNCGTVISSQKNNNILRSIFSLQNGCTIAYDIQASASQTASDAIYGMVEARAGVVRPIGYTDPDATSTDVHLSVPGTATEECQENCNNLKTNADLLVLKSIREKGMLALLKTVTHIDDNRSGFAEEGEMLEYTFTIRNTGLADITDIVIDDKLLTDQPISVEGSVLKPGEETIVKKQYRLTATDVARRQVENTALVRGKNPQGLMIKDVSGTAFDNDLSTKIVLESKPNLRLVKKVINQGTGQNGQFILGDKIIYRFDIKHEGHIAVEDVRILDPKISTESFLVNPSVLDNQSISYELSYTVTDEDMRRGRVENTAVVSGFDQKQHKPMEDRSGQTFEDDIPTITELAKPPRGEEDAYEVRQGSATWLDVLANDVEGSSEINRNSIEIVVEPTQGTVVVEEGKLRYMPAEGVANGTDRLIYRFADLNQLSSEDIEVRITIVSSTPVAVDDHYTLRYNQLIRLDAYRNDYVEHSEIVNESLYVTSYPRNGKIIVLGDGTLEYKANNNFTGYDELKYRIQDMNGNWSEEATIVINVVGFFLPNVITPNGDGDNDTFEVIGRHKFDRIELEIVNRAGKIMFQSSDYKNDWRVPESLPEGTYFYVFRATCGNEKPVVRKGTVLLMRKAPGY